MCIKYLLYCILTIFILESLAGCGDKIQIIRVMEPIDDDNTIKKAKNLIIKNKKNIKIELRYLNKNELIEMAREYDPYIEEGPLLTAFAYKISNLNTTTIEFYPERSVLLDGLGNQYSALTYETFKTLYPSDIYGQKSYSFMFEKPFPRYLKRTSEKKVPKSLFKGGKIYPGVRVEGFIIFERISEGAKEVTVILPDIKICRDENCNNVKENISIRFKFRQKIRRLE